MPQKDDFLQCTGTGINEFTVKVLVKQVCFGLLLIVSICVAGKTAGVFK